MKRFLSTVIVVVFFLLFFADIQAEARGRMGGGFGRSSSGFGRSIGRSGWGSSRSKSYSTSRSSSSWGRSSRGTKTTTIPPSPNAKPSGWTGGNMAKRKGSHGTVYKSRSTAETAYRNNLKTKWDKKPTSRPDYVPRTINTNGRNYNVSYNNGNYGYYGPGRTWVALTAANMMMTSALMTQHGFYHGTPYYSTGRGGGGMAFFIVLLIFTGFVFLGMKRFI